MLVSACFFSARSYNYIYEANYNSTIEYLNKKYINDDETRSFFTNDPPIEFIDDDHVKNGNLRGSNGRL